MPCLLMLMKKIYEKDLLLRKIGQQKPMTTGEQVRLALHLIMPAILAQLTITIMQYIDASMVGCIGPEASAAIGIVESTTWLLGGICSTLAAGFYVQVAHRLGAGKPHEARQVVREGIVTVLAISSALACLAAAVSGSLPSWLGGGNDIKGMSSSYFVIYALGIPVFQIGMFASGMLRSSGNVLLPSAMSIVMMLMKVVFNFFLIFPSRVVSVAGMAIHLPGAGLSVMGAAMGTLAAEVVSAAFLMYWLCFRARDLRLTHERGSFKPSAACFRRAFAIAAPMGLQLAVMCSADVATTVIIAPIGTYAIAANSFGMIVESLCYMPGYGIADAAATLVGQSLGAGRPALMRRFAYICVGLGIGVMSLMGVVMYFGAPAALHMMTPVQAVRDLGVEVLRIQAYAEPMFAAAIVSYGVFVGAASTFVPSMMNLVSMWGVRISLSLLFAPTMGLKGVWLAMCIELCFRGVIFITRLRWGRWTAKAAVA